MRWYNFAKLVGYTKNEVFIKKLHRYLNTKFNLDRRLFLLKVYAEYYQYTNIKEFICNWLKKYGILDVKIKLNDLFRVTQKEDRIKKLVQNEIANRKLVDIGNHKIISQELWVKGLKGLKKKLIGDALYSSAIEGFDGSVDFTLANRKLLLKKMKNQKKTELLGIIKMLEREERDVDFADVLVIDSLPVGLKMMKLYAPHRYKVLLGFIKTLKSAKEDVVHLLSLENFENYDKKKEMENIDIWEDINKLESSLDKLGDYRSGPVWDYLKRINLVIKTQIKETESEKQETLRLEELIMQIKKASTPPYLGRGPKPKEFILPKKKNLLKILKYTKWRIID